MRAVFLDKDGTLIVDEPYNVAPERVELLPGVLKGLQILHAAGYRLIVVTNQSGVARGLFPGSALIGVRDQLRQLLATGGVPLAGFYYCPHHPQGIVAPFAIECDCRKPQPGLLLQAASAQHIQLAHSWMIGDILDDVEAGRRAGCRAVLIDNGSETEWQLSPLREPQLRVRNFLEAAEYIGQHQACSSLEPLLAQEESIIYDS